MAGAPGSSVSGSPCGACKFLRRKCAADCVFAPYFSSEQGAARFAAIHKVFGASNVSKLLHHIPAHDCCEAVVTIAYEAQARVRDPVYGCVAHIFALQQQVAYLQAQLMQAKSQLAARGAAVMNSQNNNTTQYCYWQSGEASNPSCYRNFMNPISPQSSQDISSEDFSSFRPHLSNFFKRPSYDPQELGELQELALTMMKN